MAEEMAVAVRNSECKRLGSSTGKSNKSAQSAKSKKVAKKAAGHGNNAKPKEAIERGPGTQKCGPAETPQGPQYRVKDFVEENFEEILNGVLNGVKQGNASGAKLLLDYYNAPDNLDEEGLRAAEGISLADIFGADIDWDKVQLAIEHRDSLTSEAGINVGPDVEIAGREPE